MHGWLRAKRHRKNIPFGAASKSSQRPPEGPKALAPRAIWLLRSFLHWFFDFFFQKWRKCEISEAYNAKRGSEPSKTFHFRIVFSSNFHVFPKPLPNSIFGGSKCPSSLENSFLDRFSIFKGSRNRPLGRPFWPKRLQKATTPNYTTRVGADLDAIWHRKRSEDIFWLIWARFFTDFGWFWKDFAPIWRVFSTIYRFISVFIFLQNSAIIDLRSNDAYQ